MRRNNNFNTNQQNDSPSSTNEIDAAKLAVIGGFLATLGDAISTYAAILALEELQQSQNDNNNNDDRISELEKQIQYLTKEMNKQKNKSKRNENLNKPYLSNVYYK